MLDSEIDRVQINGLMARCLQFEGRYTEARKLYGEVAAICERTGWFFMKELKPHIDLLDQQEKEQQAGQIAEVEAGPSGTADSLAA